MGFGVAFEPAQANAARRVSERLLADEIALVRIDKTIQAAEKVMDGLKTS